MTYNGACQSWLDEGRIICCEPFTDDGKHWTCAHCGKYIGGPEIETQRISKIIGEAFEKAMESNWVSISDALTVFKSLLGLQGLFLVGNEIRDISGTCVAHLKEDSVKWNDAGGIDATIQPIKALDFIMVDVNIDDVKVNRE